MPAAPLVFAAAGGHMQPREVGRDAGEAIGAALDRRVAARAFAHAHVGSAMNFTPRAHCGLGTRPERLVLALSTVVGFLGHLRHTLGVRDISQHQQQHVRIVGVEHSKLVRRDIGTICQR